MRILSFILASLLFWSCASDSNTSATAGESLTALEEAYTNDNSDTNATALANAYQEAIAASKADNEIASLSQKAAQLALDRNQLLPAVATLTSAVRHYFNAPNTADNALLLGNAYEQMNQPEVANTVYQAFTKAFPKHAKVSELQSKIGSLPALGARMKSMHGQVYNDSLQQLDYKKAKEYISCSELHSMMLSSSEDSPVYIQKSAEIARALRNYPKALELYEEVLKKYPKSEQAEQALFLSAFTLDNDMKELERARTKYEAFLQQYPDSDFADDTQFLLQNLGKDEEEIIQQLQQQ